MRMQRAPRSLLSRVRIFDRVLTAQSSAALAGEDEGTYYRSPSGSHTPLSSRERAIEAVLGGLGESAAQIEHWGREYWHPIDVHRDVDEAAARGGAVRSPRSVCLLFLEVTTQAKPIAHELHSHHIYGYRRRTPHSRTRTPHPKGTAGTPPPAEAARRACRWPLGSALQRSCG
jgi:hypothetical protein